jgi:hypothetical protein
MRTRPRSENGVPMCSSLSCGLRKMEHPGYCDIFADVTLEKRLKIRVRKVRWGSLCDFFARTIVSSVVS